RSRFEPRRRLERAGRPDVDVALDAVDAKRPLLPTIAVVADDVPVAAPEQDPPRLDVPPFAAIGERDGRSGAVRVEERGQRGDGRERSDRVCGFAFASSERPPRI